MTHQTVGRARERAPQRLEEATEAYEAGETLRRGAGLDPAGAARAAVEDGGGGGRERLDAGTERLGPLAERVVRAARAAGAGPTEVGIVRDVPAETDRRRLGRVLGDLVANAHRHGRAPVVLTVGGPVVTVRDHGDGCPEYLLARGPQRFRTGGGAKGHGPGLTIAAGRAEVLGARLGFANAPDGGAVATLTLPPS